MREQGIVKVFFADRGFGFVTRTGSPNVYFSEAELEPGVAARVHRGVKVEFVVHSDERGRFYAAGVTVLG